MAKLIMKKELSTALSVNTKFKYRAQCICIQEHKLI